MPSALHLAAGQVALIEREEFGPQGWRWAEPLSGVVESDDSTYLNVSVALGDMIDGTEIMVSVFAAEALYRIRAKAHWVGPHRLAMDPIHDVERIQRRRWPRHELHLDVTLTPLALDDGNAGEAGTVAATSVAGRTMDIGMGGLRVETDDLLASTNQVSVTLMLPDGVPLVARAMVIATAPRDGGFEYRLAFDELDDLDMTNLATLLDPHATAADIRRKAAHGR